MKLALCLLRHKAGRVGKNLVRGRASSVGLDFSSDTVAEMSGGDRGFGGAC